VGAVTLKTDPNGERRGERRREPRDGSDRRVMDQTLPHSIEAEKALLGALIINPTYYATLPPGFDRQAFYREAHRTIYDAIKSLYERRVALDMLTLREEIKASGRLDECGGDRYLFDLTDGVPRSANAPHYAGIVSEHATRRSMIYLANKLIADAYSTGDSQQLLADAQRGVVEVSSQGTSDRAVSVRDLVGPAMKVLEDAAARGAMVVGVPTGVAALDEATAGLHAGQLILVAARPGNGKTALAAQIVKHAASTGRSTQLFSLEMTKDEIFMRMVSSEARVDSHRMRVGALREQDYTRIAEAMATLSGLRMVIDDTAAIPVEDLPRRVRRSALEHGDPHLIVVDYLQLLRTRGRHENRNQQVSFISSSLKALAKEIGCPVMALSQLSRGIEGRRNGTPVLSDLRESGSLEQDADVVLFLHRPSEDEDVTDLIVAQQRSGPLVTVKLVFNRQYTRFDPLDAERSEERA
jgi:replicative DNA helicase